MERISLITMPAMEVNRPSISLTQLRSTTRQRFGDRVDVEVLYLNHDFATFMSEVIGDSGGGRLYDALCANQHTGLPDWLFRQAAFPDQPDTTTEYFMRYYPGRDPGTQAFRDALLACRRELDRFLDEAIERHRIDDARIVGLTSIFAQNVASFALARRLKERNPGITIVMGGANCETPMGEEIIENVESVDYVFSGPGLLSFPAFVGHQLAGETEKCDAIPGVFSRAVTRRPLGERSGEELEINAPVELDYSDFFESFERHFPEAESEPTILFETSRGCWWGERSHCTFCGLNGLTMSYRSMEAGKAVDLINSLFERYAEKSSYFFCVDNILPRNYVADVLPHLQTPPDAKIFYEVKADLTEDDMRVMSAAGVRRIQPGIEALATSTLKLMKKGTTSFVNLRLLKNCVRYDIEPVWNLLVGFPGEGEEVYRKYVEDIPRLVHLSPPEGVAQVRFDRYSPYFVKAEEFGLKLERFDYYPLTYPFSEESLANMAYYFMDRNFDAPYLQVLSRWLGKLWGVVGEWRGKWESDNGSPPPKLTLEQRGAVAVVVDTRSGTAIEHEVSADQERLLAYLGKPQNLRNIRDYGASEGFDADLESASLDQMGLVWREGTRLMSLVLEG